MVIIKPEKWDEHLPMYWNKYAEKVLHAKRKDCKSSIIDIEAGKEYKIIKYTGAAGNVWKRMYLVNDTFKIRMNVSR